MFDPRGEAILLVGGDKSGQWAAWYVTAIPLAEKLYADYLDDLRAEGLLDPTDQVKGIIIGHRKFNDVVGDIDVERRLRIHTIKEAARADAVAFNLAELRRHRQLTQVELAKRLERAQASISAMETADDNLLSTVRSVVESMGGRLELVAVFDDERIAIATP